jgi:hypothetical protein
VATDNDLATLWVKVYSGSAGTEYPVEGYRLQIKRNGVVFATTTPSTAVFENSLLGGPIKDTFLQYNIKYEVPSPGAADWEIYLIDASGNIQSPVVKFTSSPGNMNKQIYIGFLAAGT